MQALADANAELGKYTELAKRGSLGFFEEIGATTAVKWLTDPAGTSGLGEGCGTTMENLGDSKSATSLDNMKCALETMAKVNDLRRENGRSELRVYSAIMAVSQINLNYTASHKPFYHAPSKFPYGENLAAGYKDPFVGWYDKEKVHYDKDMADGVLDGYDADGNKVGNCGHYFNILETGYTHYGCASIASRWFHLQDFDSIEGFKRLVTDDEYVEGHEILGVGPNGEYYREDGKPWTCHWEMVTPDDYLREKYGDRSYSAEEYYSLFMKYYNKVYGTLDPSYQQAVDDARAALEAAQTKASAARRRPFPPMRRRSPLCRWLCRMRRRRRAMLRFSLMRRMPKLPASKSSRIRRRSVLHPMRRLWRVPSRLPLLRTLSSRLRRKNCPMLARRSTTCRRTSSRPRKGALLPLGRRWLLLR